MTVLLDENFFEAHFNDGEERPRSGLGRQPPIVFIDLYGIRAYPFAVDSTWRTFERVWFRLIAGLNGEHGTSHRRSSGIVGSGLPARGK